LQDAEATESIAVAGQRFCNKCENVRKRPVLKAKEPGEGRKKQSTEHDNSQTSRDEDDIGEEIEEHESLYDKACAWVPRDDEEFEVSDEEECYSDIHPIEDDLERRFYRELEDRSDDEMEDGRGDEYYTPTQSPRESTDSETQH
jgi:hypothetical protein